MEVLQDFILKNGKKLLLASMFYTLLIYLLNSYNLNIKPVLTTDVLNSSP